MLAVLLRQLQIKGNEAPVTITRHDGSELKATLIAADVTGIATKADRSAIEIDAYPWSGVLRLKIAK